MKKKIKKGKYKLYAADIDEYIPEGCIYSLIPTTQKYLLIYTDQKSQKGFVEIEEAEAVKTSDEIKYWLFGCKSEVLKNYVEDNEKVLRERANIFLKLFETELKKEADKIRSENKKSEHSSEE